LWLAYQLFNDRHRKIDAATLSRPDLAGARQQPRNRVQNKLAAGVNVLPQMDSIYVWQGELRQDKEHKVFIETSEPRLAALQREIKGAHPYSVAEIPGIKIDSGDPEYLDWISVSTQ
jgi:periplasmic divalent cation tolerance protein